MTVALVLFATALVVVPELLLVTAAGVLARIEGATYPAAIRTAATAFVAVLTLACLRVNDGDIQLSDRRHLVTSWRMWTVGWSVAAVRWQETTVPAIGRHVDLVRSSW